jgi:hypothetical protein
MAVLKGKWLAGVQQKGYVISCRKTPAGRNFRHPIRACRHKELLFGF